MGGGGPRVSFAGGAYAAFALRHWRVLWAAPRRVRRGALVRGRGRGRDRGRGRGRDRDRGRGSALVVECSSARNSWLLRSYERRSCISRTWR